MKKHNFFNPMKRVTLFLLIASSVTTKGKNTTSPDQLLKVNSEVFSAGYNNLTVRFASFKVCGRMRCVREYWEEMRNERI